jgi:hypothetical protein
MSEMATVLGMPQVVHFENMDYKVHPRTFEIEALFELWLEKQALRAIERHAVHMGPVWREEQMTAWRRDCASRVYSFGAPETVSAPFNPPGEKYLAYLMLVKHNTNVTEELVERMWKHEETRALLRPIIWKSEAEDAKEAAAAGPSGPLPVAG